MTQLDTNVLLQNCNNCKFCSVQCFKNYSFISPSVYRRSQRGIELLVLFVSANILVNQATSVSPLPVRHLLAVT